MYPFAWLDHQVQSRLVLERKLMAHHYWEHNQHRVRHFEWAWGWKINQILVNKKRLVLIKYPEIGYVSKELVRKANASIEN